MKKVKLTLCICSFLLMFSIVFVSCKKEQISDRPEALTEPALPAYPYNYEEKHGVNTNLATLGRVLFYDKILSVNNKVSCASCHKQEFAFADNVQFNKGFDGRDLTRNSPSIQGIRGFLTDFFNQSGSAVPNSTIKRDGFPDNENQLPVLLFWDGRQTNLANMVLNPILNHKEMNLPDFETLIARLNATSYYPTLFEKTFYDKSITKERIAYALEGFISCLNTNDVRAVFDPRSVDPKDPGTTNFNQPASFKTLEEEGQFLFHRKYNCATCHDPSNSGSYGAVTSPNQMFNIGLEEVYKDNGLGALTKKPGDNGLFKVPTLKNISLTAPYMHDGRFTNLGEVIDHYSHGIKANNNLSQEFVNINGTPKKLNILASEKKALIAFLNTLKDEDFLTSPMYADPFKK